MAFKLKSGNKVDFKMMGSSPVRNMKDGDYSQSFEKSPMRKDDPSNEVDPFASDSFKGYDDNSSTTSTDKKEDTDNSEQGTSSGDLSNVVPTTTSPPVETEENKIKTTDGSNLGDELDDAKNADERKKLMDQAKKEMYANAWQNSGIGHIVEAGKSIGRGIKNIKAKKAKRVEEAKKAEGEGTETLKQAKLVKRARKKESRAIKREVKDQKKLAKFRKKNPKQDYTGKSKGATPSPPVTDTDKKSGAPLLGDRKKKKATKKKMKEFKKRTVVKNGKTYDKKNIDYSSMNTEQLMKIKKERGL